VFHLRCKKLPLSIFLISLEDNDTNLPRVSVWKNYNIQLDSFHATAMLKEFCSGELRLLKNGALTLMTVVSIEII
jgi:hypothetical protein